MRYADVLRLFYGLPRNAFPELPKAEAALSRSVRALVRRRLATKVRGYRWAVTVKLTTAGSAVAARLPPSRTLPRGRVEWITLRDGDFLVRELDELTERESEQFDKAKRRLLAAAKRRGAAIRARHELKKTLTT